MSRAIEYIIEVDELGAKQLIESLLNPKPNPKREKIIRDALALKFEIR
jgi:hypothetical protein